MLTFETNSVQGVAAITEKLSVGYLDYRDTMPGDRWTDIPHPAEPAFRESAAPDRYPRCPAFQRPGWDPCHGDWRPVGTFLDFRYMCMLTRVQVDQESKPMSYTQSFQLLPDGQGSYFVFNDIFRLIYSAA